MDQVLKTLRPRQKARSLVRSMTPVKWSLLLLLWTSGMCAPARLAARAYKRSRAVNAGASAATIGLKSVSGDDLVAQTDWAGNLNIYSVYQPENDVPDQYKALQTIHAALGGDYWSSAFKQTSYAQQLQALEDNLPADSK